MTTANEILDGRPHKTYSSRANFQYYAKLALIAAGYEAIKATYDDAGNCHTCGEAGRCPGYHTEDETIDFPPVIIHAVDLAIPALEIAEFQPELFNTLAAMPLFSATPYAGRMEAFTSLPTARQAPLPGFEIKLKGAAV